VAQANPRQPPALGAPAPVIGQPIKAPTPPRPAPPKVESYDEQNYRAVAGDTFRSISARFYHSDKYERALVLFNRSHPMGCEGSRQDPPRLQPGEIVHLPPVYILERRYPAAIPDSQPPMPVTPPPPPVAVAPPPAPPTQPTGDKLYRVAVANQRFTDIARQVLGNPLRWEELYRLNPTFNPGYPVPVGTVLRVPADAQVP
jgi:nucleoid-associated protein YgaU